ncbi:MAG TPA: von Willebrand factor type A domain-containing protein [Pirellulales bacterium]|jgi:Ca-activated chloride channel family protein|nr:von Willebrand factor type A domain-containing protein [Pirellulales bacterium]
MFLPSDPDPDADLRNVPLPEDLAARLKQIAVAGDADLDAALQAVVPAPNLIARLQALPLTDDALEFALKDVPVPAQLSANLRRLASVAPGRRRTAPEMQRMALAASLLLAVGLSAYGWISLQLLSHFQNRPPLAVNPPQTSATQVVQNELNPPLEISPQPDDFPADENDFFSPAEIPHWQPPELAGNHAREFLHVPPGNPAPDLDRIADRYGVFGADATFDRLPDLMVVPSLQPRGIAAPRAKGYDLLFALAKQTNPFVSLAGDESLQSCPIPLVRATESYDLARTAVAAGNLPAKESIRIEEFLAALDYQFAPPEPGRLGIRTAAGVAPFAAPGTNLLQIGVQAAPPERTDRRPRHITLVLDVSASMRHGGRWDRVRRAVSSWLNTLGAEDRLSIVVFRQDAELVVAQATRADADSVRQKLQTLAPRGSTSLGNGLLLGYALAQQDKAPQGALQRLVLVTDGLADMTSDVAARMQAMITDFAQAGVSLDVIDLVAEQRGGNLWHSLARSGGGRLESLHDAQEIGSALRNTLESSSRELVAKNVQLKVIFQPAAVESYRLLGHDPQLNPAWSAAETPVELGGGDAASGLLEVRLRTSGDERIGRVELTWLNPRTNQTERLSQPLSRLQFGHSFREAPMSLQEASLLAETAEILRESPFTPPAAHSLERILALAAEANPRLRERSDFLEWRAFVEQAIKAKAGSRRALAH